MDTETVTVVCADLVAATSLAHRLGPDELDAELRGRLAAIRDAVDVHGGATVTSPEDGVMAVFPSASAALDFAVGVERSLSLADPRPSVMALRVGISAGEARHGDGEVIGDAVVEAARLCGRAEAGEILVAEVVRTMAGRRSSAGFSSAGVLELKGLSSPVATLRLDWEPLSSRTTVPLPAPLSRHLETGFTGRDDERAVLSAAVARAADGHRSVVVVAGEPGIGKTAVVAKLAREAYRHGSTVLYGRCQEELEVPYQPFIEALTQYVVHAPLDVLASHVEEHGGELARLVPVLALRVPACPEPVATEVDAERYLAFNAAAGLLAAASGAEPLLLVVDDLHWADKPTLQLLRFLVDSTQPMRVCFVFTFRGSELSRAHPLLDVLAKLRRESAMRVQLEGLTEEELGRLIAKAAGRPLDAEGFAFVRLLRRETDGNPFFVWEILRHLAESGALIADAAGRWSLVSDTDDLALPQSVREVVEYRVLRLGAEAEQALALAAVIGRDFDLELLEALTGTPEDELLDTIERAVVAELVTEAPGSRSRFSFSHALVQHTLYQSIGETRRRRAHRRLALALERRYGSDPRGHAGELAHHWARDSDPQRALFYAALAGDSALESLAPDDAVRWYGEALELLGEIDGDDGPRCDLLIGLGTAQRQSGNAEYRRTLLDACALARSIGDAGRLSTAALANYRGLWSVAGEVDEERVAALEAALAMTDGADSPERARLLALSAAELTFSAPLERRRALADEAKAMAERLGDAATVVMVLNSVVGTLWVPATLAERASDSDRATELAVELHDPVVDFTCAAYRMRAALEGGDIEASDRALEVMEALSEELGRPFLRWQNAWSKACRALLAGDPDVAEVLAGEALSIAEASGQPDAVTFYSTQLVGARWQQGRSDEMVGLIEEAARSHPGIPGYWAALARSLCDAGRADAASALVAEATDRGFAHMHEDVTWSSGMAMYADAVITLGDRRAAGPLYDLLAPWPTQLAYLGTSVEGPIAHYLGGLAALLGRGTQADAHFAQALEISSRMGAKFFVARTQLAWGGILAERPDTESRARGRRLLEQAATAAAAHGYGVVARRARAALAGSGGLGDPAPVRR